jgi:beta-galactosidase/beta-glucuronidase
MRRKDWLNLNGLWQYKIVPKKQTKVTEFNGQILVPFPIESALSGVKCPLLSDEQLWYRRIFSIPPGWRGKRVLLHFGAVDWESRVFVNSQPVGEHVGGYLPFWFDITDMLVHGTNELILSVWDPTDTHWQQRGKQVLKPKTIWYKAVSGIWQTVWLEPVPQTYVSSLKITPDIDAGIVSIKVNLAGNQTVGRLLQIKVRDAGVLINSVETNLPELEFRVPIPAQKLWSPDLPHLYDLEISSGEDKVGSYFGMRKFSVENGRLCLNNRQLFQFGPLDQGYWPDGLYTPPTDEAMLRDIELVKRLGCNMLRKHVKVEPARYYYYCDKLGLIVWQDMPNGGAAVNEMHMFLINTIGLRYKDRNFRRVGRAEAVSREDYQRELHEMVDHLYNFACIGMWVPFNEGWGQFNAKAVADWLKGYDPTRPVDHASGWFDQHGGDCNSLHIYFRKLKGKRAGKKRATVLSEFGAYSLKMNGHLWNPSAEFGYKKFATPEILTKAYLDLIETELKPWVATGLSAAVYTQTADVEDEVNGYVTYDRKTEKMDFMKVRAAHRGLININKLF